jgi:hypothetical protein
MPRFSSIENSLFKLAIADADIAPAFIGMKENGLLFQDAIYPEGMPDLAGTKGAPPLAHARW